MPRRSKNIAELNDQQKVLLQNVKDAFQNGAAAYNEAVAAFNASLSEDQIGHAKVNYEQLPSFFFN